MLLNTRQLNNYRSSTWSNTLKDYVRPFHQHQLSKSHNTITDWWCGKRFQNLRTEGYFQKSTDIAQDIHYDGVQAQNRHSHSVAAVILYNYNLPPKIRYARENTFYILILGPCEQKDLNSFLQPLVAELDELGKGIPVYDADSRHDFELKVDVVLVGDMLFFILL